MTGRDIDLAAAIRALRAELIAAVQESEYEDVRFALGPVELEVQVEIVTGDSGPGRIQYWVASGRESEEGVARLTHRLRLSLTPTLASETPGSVPLVVGVAGVDRPR